MLTFICQIKLVDCYPHFPVENIIFISSLSCICLYLWNFLLEKLFAHYSNWLCTVWHFISHWITWIITVFFHTTSYQESNRRNEYYPTTVFTFGFFCSNIVLIVFFFSQLFRFDVLIVNVVNESSVSLFQTNGYVFPISHFEKYAKIWREK